MKSTLIACAISGLLFVSPNTHAEDFAGYLLKAVTPKGPQWQTKNDDEMASAFANAGVKRYKWSADTGKDEITLFVLPGQNQPPSAARDSDTRAAEKNCKTHISQTDMGDTSTPYMGWSVICTQANGNVMTLRHFAYQLGGDTYKVSRTWREMPSEQTVAQWSATLASIADHINSTKP